MAQDQKPSERERTDKSLALERDKTDAELAKRAGALEENADAVVERARRRADDVVANARARADDTLSRNDATANARGTVEAERQQEDIALGRERAAHAAGGARRLGRRTGRVGNSVRGLDTGCGIALDQLGAIFERYWQTKRERAGLGLGLYISRCIVEAHAGKIWAESRLGEGSTFYFTLPAAPSDGRRG